MKGKWIALYPYPSPRSSPRTEARVAAARSFAACLGAGRRVRDRASRRPARVALLVMALIVCALVLAKGLHNFGQATVDGAVTGSYFAVGAVGLTLIYGILKLVNFAYGDYMTLGAYSALLLNVTAGLPLIVAVIGAVAVVAAFSVGLELILWRPMRRRRAGISQLMILSLGLAFIVRYTIQLIAGSGEQSLRVNVTSSVAFLGLRVGRTELLVVIVGFLAVLAIGLLLSRTNFGKQMRALADNVQLAETSGINIDRVVLGTWAFAGGLAGLAGVLYGAALGVITPNIGLSVLLSLFAAVILGGLGNAYGALAGGLTLGLAQEWSTLFIASQWKVAVGFVVLILVLIVRPQGIFGLAGRL